MDKRSDSEKPMCWNRVKAILTKGGASKEAVEAARLGYSAGVYNGLFMLGDTSTADNIFASWHEFFAEAKADVKEELEKRGQKL